MTPTCVYDAYWRFAAERHAMYERRLQGTPGPWTADLVLRNYRFTNVYRASDRVSQYLIREVQYHPDRSQSAGELFFRTLLFKIFNKIETWELLEHALGSISWRDTDFASIDSALDNALRRGARIYSAAYIMPSPPFGHSRKHSNHLALLASMMDDELPARIQKSLSLRHVYELLKPYPGLGPFLAFQYAIDLNYSRLLEFDESDLVIAGPGALDGIAKCFGDRGRTSPEDVIYAMVDRQEREFERLSLPFNGLYGRRLQPIDCQNIFCEISKYARVTHPEVRGTTERKRIKQSYKPASRPMSAPTFPPRWHLVVPSDVAEPHAIAKQLQLL